MGFHSITSKLKKMGISFALSPKNSDFDLSFTSKGQKYLVKFLKVDKQTAIRIPDSTKYLTEKSEASGVGYGLMTYKNSYDIKNLTSEKDNIVLVFKEPSNVFIEDKNCSRSVAEGKHFCAESYKNFMCDIEKMGA